MTKSYYLNFRTHLYEDKDATSHVLALYVDTDPLLVNKAFLNNKITFVTTVISRRHAFRTPKPTIFEILSTSLFLWTSKLQLWASVAVAIPDPFRFQEASLIYFTKQIRITYGNSHENAHNLQEYHIYVHYSQEYHIYVHNSQEYHIFYDNTINEHQLLAHK